MACKPTDDKAKDPGPKHNMSSKEEQNSVEFRDLKIIAGRDGNDRFVCGLENSKDSSGEYKGFRSFFGKVTILPQETTGTDDNYTINDIVVEPNQNAGNGQAFKYYKQAYQKICYEELPEQND